MSDIMSSLRRLAFPESCRVAIEKLGSCFSQDVGIPGLGGADEEVAEQLANEFIFQETPGRNGQIKKLSAIQQLQVLEIVVKYYSREMSNDWLRHSVFKAMFSGTLSSSRSDFLAKLVSMAIGVRNSTLLDCTAVWMQRQGCSTDAVAKVVGTVVGDYCLLVPGAASSLLTLPKLSPHFTCNFITALTTTYTPTGSRGGRQMLPPALLELITDWMVEDAHLCLVSLCHAQNAFIQPQRSSLWTSPTKPNTQTPIPGLVRWSAQSPLLHRLSHLRKNNGIITNGHRENGHTSLEMGPKEQQIWSRLHLALLQTLLAFPTLPGANQLELLTLADMMRIVKDTSSLLAEIGRRDPSLSPLHELTQEEFVQVSVNRLVQILQVALTTGSFRCSLSDLQNICNQIPPNKLLSILQSQHLARTPPLMHHEARNHLLNVGGNLMSELRR